MTAFNVGLLGAYFSSKKWGLNKWNSKTVYGYDFSRNQAFKSAVDSLVPIIKEAFKEAKFKSADVSMKMSNYIACNFANHIMKSLLDPANIAEFNYQEIQEKFVLYELPEYDKNKINIFQLQWLQINETTSISIDTENKHEQELISAKLASQISELIGKINIKTFMVGAVRSFNQLQQENSAQRQAVFSQAGNASTMYANNRTAYTENDQKQDLTNTIRSDLAGEKVFKK